ncbi:MAG: PqqD family protein [Rivularia sp. (in: cyanobacteria)]
MNQATSILNQKLSISENALAQEVNREIVILNFESESYYTLDTVGTKFWQLFTDSDSVETVIQQLVKFYTVDEAALRRDVTKFVEELVEEGLLINGDRAIDKSHLS